MEELTKKEYGMIKNYKKTKDQNVPLYFFNKFKVDLDELIFYKINNKFSSVPFEKGDLFYFIWNGIKKTLLNFKKGQDFNSLLIRNCYLTTLNEIRKFVRNGELLMNVSYSLESYEGKVRNKIDVNRVDNNQITRNIALDRLIEDACEYVKTYHPKTIKNVIYLKSLGYSKSEIAKKLNIKTYYVSDLLKNVEKMVKEIYGL